MGDREDGDAQDHGADVLGGHRFEEVGAAAGAVADVVADEVGDDGGVARVVLRDARLDLADEVSADVGSLGVDTAAELGEERYEAGAEAEADDQERRDLRRVVEDAAVDEEDARDAEEAQRDDEEAGDGAAAKRDRDRVLQALLSGGRGPDVGAHGDEHTDVAGEAGAERADQERDAGEQTLLPAADHDIGGEAHLAVFELDRLDAVRDRSDEHGDRDGRHDGQDGDRPILARQEGHGAFEDHAGDLLHRGCARVPLEHVLGQP